MLTEPVVIVGGGPAGVATALTLARRGIPSLIIEASGSPRAKIGETLPANTAPLLQVLGLDLHEPEHLPCYGNQYQWGGTEIQEKLFLLQPHHHGWHLDRRLFEVQLADRVQEAGVRWLFGCRLLSATAPTPAQWQLVVERDGQKQELQTRFVVDASGRTARLARVLGIKRHTFDRLLGLACTITVPSNYQLAQYTYIEAAATGWWYLAPISGQRLIVVFMTDADLLDRTWLHGDVYLQALRGTHWLGSLLPPALSSADISPIVARAAATSRLSQIVGENWLAVGDAASAYDPISSFGITSALGSGFYAGQAIADHFNGKGEALPAYCFLQEQAYQIYIELWHYQYHLEQRWPDSPFWKRRHTMNPEKFFMGMSTHHSSPVPYF